MVLFRSEEYLKRLSSDFSDGRIEATYADVKIGIDMESCIKINSLVRYGELILPKRSNVDNEISLTEKRTTGTIGCVTGATSSLDIRAEFCDVAFFE